MQEKIKSYQEVFWINEGLTSAQEAISAFESTVSMSDIQAADRRLRRFGPFFMAAFPETVKTEGIIESDLIDLAAYQREIHQALDMPIAGKWHLKMDSHLPISGSVKARGGVYEVIKWAETLAQNHGLIDGALSYAQFLEADFRALFAQHTISVGSTGNLGLSIGIIARALGFQVHIHMSKDAKPWKIQKLRDLGAQVFLYEANYAKAVAEGRKKSALDPKGYFIDDENSKDLFVGYGVAGIRLRDQLEKQQVLIDSAHPLFVYIPCGVGGAPGGIAYALKQCFGDDVHVFFAEPTHAPCMLLGLSTGRHHLIAIEDEGLDGRTVADGLAVGRPSQLVSQCMAPLLSGAYTVSDEVLLAHLYGVAKVQNIGLEPSALAGVLGPMRLYHTKEGQNYLKRKGLWDKRENITHISWATGGSLVPSDIMAADMERGKAIFTER